MDLQIIAVGFPGSFQAVNCFPMGEKQDPRLVGFNWRKTVKFDEKYTKILALVS